MTSTEWVEYLGTFLDGTLFPKDWAEGIGRAHTSHSYMNQSVSDAIYVMLDGDPDRMRKEASPSTFFGQRLGVLERLGSCKLSEDALSEFKKVIECLREANRARNRIEHDRPIFRSREGIPCEYGVGMIEEHRDGTFKHHFYKKQDIQRISDDCLKAGRRLGVFRRSHWPHPLDSPLIETITLTERAEESVLKGLALAREMGAQPLVEQLEADLARVRDPSPPGQGRAAPPR